MKLSAKLVIGSDARTPDQLDHLGFGVDQARPGWVEPIDLLNTLSAEALRAGLRCS